MSMFGNYYYNNGFDYKDALAYALAISQRQDSPRNMGSRGSEGSLGDLQKKRTREVTIIADSTEITSQKRSYKKQKGVEGRDGFESELCVEQLQIIGGLTVPIVIPKPRRIDPQLLLTLHEIRFYSFTRTGLRSHHFLSSKGERYLTNILEDKKFSHDSERYLGERKIALIRAGQWSSEIQGIHNDIQIIIDNAFQGFLAPQSSMDCSSSSSSSFNQSNHNVIEEGDLIIPGGLHILSKKPS